MIHFLLRWSYKILISWYPPPIDPYKDHDCSKDGHIWGKWEMRWSASRFQHRDCKVCNFREERFIG